MKDLLRPLLVLLALIIVLVLIVVALLGGFGGGGDGDGDAKKADNTEKSDQKPPKGTISAQALKLGNCITNARSTSGDVRTFITVDCDEPHDGEVYTLIELKGEKYPGKKFVVGKGDRGCRARLTRQATRKALNDGNLAPYRFVYPTPASWKQDYHSITCLATFTKARKGRLAQRR
jgi:hypothetical protein